MIYKVIDLYLSCKLTFVYNPIAFVIFIYCAHCIRSLNHLQRLTLLPLFLVIRLAKWDIATVLSQSLSQGNHSLLDETIENFYSLSVISSIPFVTFNAIFITFHV